MKYPSAQLGVSLAVLVALLLAYGAWYAYVAHETARASSLEASIVAEGDAATRAAAAERTLAQLGPREADIKSRFVPVSGVVSFLEDVQNVGTREGATVTVGSVSQQDDPRPHLDIALTISGSFDAVMRTMGVLENGPYDIEAGQATIASSGTSIGTSVWSATMTLSVGTSKTAVSTTTPSFFTGPAAPPSQSATPPAPGDKAGAGSSGAVPVPGHNPQPAV